MQTFKIGDLVYAIDLEDNPSAERFLTYDREHMRSAEVGTVVALGESRFGNCKVKFWAHPDKEFMFYSSELIHVPNL